MTYFRGSKRELIVTLAYLPYDSEEPPLPSKGLREVVDYCSRNKLQLIIGCGVTAHHIIWLSTDINPQGECLMEYLFNTNLNFLIKVTSLLLQLVIGRRL
jgi:hypothetical protein